MIPLPHRVGEVESQLIQLRGALVSLRRDVDDMHALDAAEHRVFRSDLALIHSLVQRPSGAMPGSRWICSKLRFLQSSVWNLAMRLRSLHAMRGHFPDTAMSSLRWPAPQPLSEELFLQVDEARL